MADAEYFNELQKRTASGDLDAGKQFLELQRQGRALRMYPDGRQGIDDSGAIAFALQCFGSPPDRKWLLKSGVQTQVISIPVEKASHFVTTIIDAVSSSAVEYYPVQCALNERTIWIRMPSEAIEWCLTDCQLLGFTGLLMALLESHGR